MLKLSPEELHSLVKRDPTRRAIADAATTKAAREIVKKLETEDETIAAAFVKGWYGQEFSEGIDG